VKPAADSLDSTTFNVKSELNSGINTGEPKPPVTLTGVAFSSAHISKPAKFADHLTGIFQDNQQSKALVESLSTATNSGQMVPLHTANTISTAAPVPTTPTHGRVEKDTFSSSDCSTSNPVLQPIKAAVIPVLPAAVVAVVAPKKSRFTVKTIHVVEVRIYSMTSSC
jgi:hypothetical protein